MAVCEHHFLFCVILLNWYIRSGDVGSKEENPLLPTTQDDFMITDELLVFASSLLSGIRSNDNIDKYGKLYFQSNVEDVAMYVRTKIEGIQSPLVYGLEPPAQCCPVFKTPVSASASLELYTGAGGRSNLPKTLSWCTAKDTAECDETRRRQLWRARGGAEAVGKGWLPCSVFPESGRTETEVVREAEGKSVFRAVFICNKLFHPQN